MSDQVVLIDRILETVERLASRIVALEARPAAETEKLPPELAEQVKDAIRLLYAATPFPALPATAQSGVAHRPSRIERDDSGGYSLVYDDDEPQT
jgi:hypothetical protein